MMNPHEKELFSTEEAAHYMGTTARTFREWHRKGKADIPVIRIGRTVRYLKADLDEFIRSKRETSQEKDNPKAPNAH